MSPTSSSSLVLQFQLMATYNQWMNDALYQAASQLTTEEIAKDRGAFFKSILGTFNHLMVADTIWLKRFATHPGNFSALQAMENHAQPPSLDAVLFNDLDSCYATRKIMDTMIIAFAQQLTEEHLNSDLSYNKKGQVLKKPFNLVLQHFFNHQTHHRGQVTTLLTQAGVTLGATDFLLLIPNSDEQ